MHQKHPPAKVAVLYLVSFAIPKEAMEKNTTAPVKIIFLNIVYSSC
jgi:hypothetical protein